MIPLEQPKEMAAAVADDMRGGVSPEVRQRFIEVRSELFQRGIYDPVLVRFDSATVPRDERGVGRTSQRRHSGST